MGASLLALAKSIYYIYIYTVPQVKSKTICFPSLTYISAVLNGLHQGEWPSQASHTIITEGQNDKSILQQTKDHYWRLLLPLNL